MATDSAELPERHWRSRVAVAIATAAGAGFSPVAPGTAGTAITVPLAYLLADVPLPAYLALCALVIAVGVWAADVADRWWGTHDSGRIVIDEVAGYLITVAFVDRASWVMLVAGFIVFRAFDITKPPPVRRVDERLGGGLGVVLDDVVAGALGAPLMWAVGLTDLAGQLFPG